MRSLVSLALSCLLVAANLPTASAEEGNLSSPAPTISKIRGRTVTVTVPDGFDAVSLQTSRAQKGKKERVWATVNTKFTQGAASTLTFRLPRLTPRRLLRTVATPHAPLPDRFVTGLTNFGADKLTLSLAGGGLTGTTTGTTTGPTSNLNFSGDVAGNQTATVVESDIWKIDGDRLYFFNQLRGLQVLDIANPDAPRLLGSLRMPASGEDLYLLDHDHVALLKSSYSFGIGIFNGPIVFAAASAPAAATAKADATSSSLTVTNGHLGFWSPYVANRNNELVVVDVSTGAPKSVGSLPFEGSILDSRLVGNILYVATSGYRTADANGASGWGATVTAFDLSDPAQPIKRDSLFLSGAGGVVTATPGYFLITSSNWSTGDSIHLVDISGGDGTLKEVGTVALTGRLQDKFKLNLNGDTLTAVTFQWARWGLKPDGTYGILQPAGTTVETFSLQNPAAPVALGSLRIAEGETLRATRFDGSRLYVVTFEQIDPLHIIDLSDPAQPVMSGQVDAPGFSTYIEPLGDRLVSIGLVDWQPAISLFDVADPAAPKLIQQLPLRSRDSGWSHSEAVWNEKAFKVLAEQNLILLPVSGYDFDGTDAWGGTWFSRVQIVDLLRDSLVRRGVITTPLSPRRADVVKDRIVAISPSKFLSVDATNRDTPSVTAEIELAWSVDRVFQSGDYLVQIGASLDGATDKSPVVSVSPKAEPDTALTLLDLAPLDVVGAELQGGVLFVAQRAWPRWWVNDRSADQPELLVSALDVSALPAIKLLSKASGPAPVQSWGQCRALWPTAGTLVWVFDGRYVPNAGVYSADVLSANLTLVPYRWWGGWSKQFVAFSVGVPEKIVYSSSLELSPSSGATLDTPLASGGLVLCSETQWWNGDDQTADDVGKHFLRVADYAEPTAPFLRPDRVNIPGTLVAASREAKLLYTTGAEIDPVDGTVKTTPAIHASAFDGTAAHLITSLPTAGSEISVALSGADLVYLSAQPVPFWGWIRTFQFALDSVPEPTPASTSSLHVVSLTEAGTFTEYGSLDVASDTELRLFGDLAVTQPDWSSVRPIDLSSKSAPVDLGVKTLSGRLNPDLEKAAGQLGSALWLATGSYGVETIDLSK